jgi:hypothetical protein
VSDLVGCPSGLRGVTANDVRAVTSSVGSNPTSTAGIVASMITVVQLSCGHSYFHLGAPTSAEYEAQRELKSLVEEPDELLECASCETFEKLARLTIKAR